MNSTSYSAIAIGMKGAGKTTYLAALWNLLEEGAGDSCAVLAELQPDREYLQGIRAGWLELSPAQRTSVGTTEHASVVLNVRGVLSQVALNVPDLSGELFASQWETRQTTRSFAAMATEANGILLFVHPYGIQPRPRIDAERLGELPTTSSGGASEWEPHLAPTQVQLVDCLQFVSFLSKRRAERRVAVIVSAWDVVGDPMRPRDWVQRRLPLLFQFLETGGSGFEAEYFGVSGQGGAWPDDKWRLQDVAPAERAYLVEGFERHRDLARPIQWLIAGRMENA